MFDDDFLGCMAELNELDKIVLSVCNCTSTNFTYNKYLSPIDKEYISKEVYRRSGKILNWD